MMYGVVYDTKYVCYSVVLVNHSFTEIAEKALSECSEALQVDIQKAVGLSCTSEEILLFYLIFAETDRKGFNSFRNCKSLFVKGTHHNYVYSNHSTSQIL